MPIYAYTARDEGGKIFKGTIEALDEKQARQKLRKRAYFVTTIREIRRLNLDWFFGGQSISGNDLVLFSQQFAGMIKAGMTLRETLQVLERQAESKVLKKVIKEIRDDVESGSTLSASVSKHVNIFPPFFPHLLKTGEETGTLGEVLDNMASYLERMNDLKQKMKSVFMYPAIVLGVAFFVVGFLLTYVIPTFTAAYIDLHLKLPLPTQILILLSNFINGYKFYIVLFFLAAVLSWYIFKSTKQGKRQIDLIKLKIPIIGKVNQEIILTRFIRTFASMIKNGIPILQALLISEGVVDNVLFAEVIEKMRLNVTRGKSLTEPLYEAEDLFPPMVVQAVAGGEKSGALGELLEKTAHFLDTQLDYSVKRLASRIEPILTLGLGSIIAFFALAIYLPMFDLMAEMGAGK